MSRSGYSDDCEDQWQLIRWRGAVKSAIRGSKGQAFLREIIAALDALPEKRLIENDLHSGGAYCTLGAVGKTRGTDMDHIDPDDQEAVAGKFGIAHAMACEIMFENDECGWPETPEQRWLRMRSWAASRLSPGPLAKATP